MSSDERRETSTMFHPLERVNLNHWLALSKVSKRMQVFLPSTDDRNRLFKKYCIF
jgi:hypothetical protein